MVRKDLAVKSVGTLNLRDVAARATLRALRLKGHAYIELRQLTKRSIFFCTLCLTQCYSESALYDHLRGNFHSKRYTSAKITLLLPNPWPFNDGVLFFDNSRENDLNLVSEIRNGTFSTANEGRCAATVNGDTVTSKFRCDRPGITSDHIDHFRNVCNAGNYCKVNGHAIYNSYSGSQNKSQSVVGQDKMKKCKGVQEHFSISYVLPNDEFLNYELKIIGFGHMGAKIDMEGEKSCKFSRIWCAWLGDASFDGCDDEVLASPKCDFAIVNLSYTYNLGRKFAMEDENVSPSTDSFFEIDESGRRTKKRKKSFSDPEDNSEAFADRCASSCEHSHNRDCRSPVFSHSSTFGRAGRHVERDYLGKHKCSSSERNCDICQQPMLPGKDIATLLNLKTGRFACSSRNINGAFHLFHASCLIHWVLFSEFELWAKQAMNPKRTRGRKGKASNKNHMFSSIFCPECQGTGIHIVGNVLERPTVPLSETFMYKLNVIKAQKAWMNSPENLQKCSTGLCFPAETTTKLQGKEMPEKLLLFYRAGE